MNKLEGLKIKVMEAFRIYNAKNNVNFNIELVNKLDCCKTINEINELLKTNEFKEINKILENAEKK